MIMQEKSRTGPVSVFGILIFLAVNFVIAALFFSVGETWATVVGGLLVAEGIVYLVLTVIRKRRKQEQINGGGRFS